MQVKLKIIKGLLKVALKRERLLERHRLLETERERDRETERQRERERFCLSYSYIMDRFLIKVAFGSEAFIRRRRIF